MVALALSSARRSPETILETMDRSIDRSIEVWFACATAAEHSADPWKFRYSTFCNKRFPSVTPINDTSEMLAPPNLPKTADTKFQTAVYPSNLARIGTKLCQNAFRTIPNVLFFDAKKQKSAKFSDEKFCFSQIWRGFTGGSPVTLLAGRR